jgi:hypothetical protein
VVRLGEVIVPAGAQTRDSVIDLAERAQNQHRRFATRGAQRLHERETIELRQHPVHDRQIQRHRGSQVQPFEPVDGDVHRMARFAQRLGQIIARNLVVFDDKDMHKPYITDVGPIFVAAID